MLDVYLKVTAFYASFSCFCSFDDDDGASSVSSGDLSDTLDLADVPETTSHSSQPGSTVSGNLFYKGSTQAVDSMREKTSNGEQSPRLESRIQ